MNEVTVFNNEEFGKVRTLTVNKEPWFVLKDICSALEVSRSHITDKLEKDEVNQIPLTDSMGREQKTTVIFVLTAVSVSKIVKIFTNAKSAGLK